MGGWTTERPRDPRVDDRVIEILSERAGRIAFNGLRRALGIHPESLSRALRRLEREGLVIRGEDGYALRQKAPRSRGAAPESRVIASVELPPVPERTDILGRLAGRWFGDLRWVGLYEHPGDPWLVWSASGANGHVMLSVRGGTLRVLIEGPAPDDRLLEKAAYQLLAHALQRIRQEPRPQAQAVATLDGERPGTVATLN
jgi:DNA-binding transcriptional ArsR family regulator